jgi:hypothetical protein
MNEVLLIIRLLVSGRLGIPDPQHAGVLAASPSGSFGVPDVRGFGCGPADAEAGGGGKERQCQPGQPGDLHADWVKGSCERGRVGGRPDGLSCWRAGCGRRCGWGESREEAGGVSCWA